MGTNSEKTHPAFGRGYGKKYKPRHHLHAEMNVLRYAKPGDDLIVIRFRCDGSLAMARPCKFCQEHIEKAGIRKVYYTDWSGNFKLFEKENENEESTRRNQARPVYHRLNP